MTLGRCVCSFTAAILAVTLLLINSLVVFASTPKIAGEIIVSDRGADVTVNGEVVKTGRSIFTGSTIDTPQEAGATVLIASLGRLELAPSTSITLVFDENGISGTLVAGRVSVLSAEREVSINGKIYNAGESVDTGTTSANNTRGARSGGGGSGIWLLAVIVGGALVAILVASSSSNSSNSGGGTTPVSPVR